MNAQAYDQYRKASVETVTPEKLLIMLYDGAIRKLDNAKKALEDKDINRAHQEIIKVEDIIIELMSTLNMDYEISHNLFVLYEYLYNQLVQANFKKDSGMLSEVQSFLMELRETWSEAIKNQKTAASPEAVHKPADQGLNVAQEPPSPKKENTMSGPLPGYQPAPALKTFNTSALPPKPGINIKG